jgi:putative DNA primase/helicase
VDGVTRPTEAQAATWLCRQLGDPQTKALPANTTLVGAMPALARAVGMDWNALGNEEAARHFVGEEKSGGSDETPRKRPLITIRAGDLASIATEAEAALVAAGVPFFKRGGVIVRPIADSVPAAKGKRATILRTVQVSKESITDHLARVADWQKFDERKNKMVRANPPSQVAEIILSRDGEWRFKELAGVIGNQTLRPDLSLLSEPGRDEATALWLGDPPAMPDLPLKPTRAQAEEALALLNGLLRDFVFVTEADRSVALSMLMTPIVRGAMSCAPMHAVRAPTPGSGKSFLVDLAAALATGQPCPVISPHTEEKELEKRLGGALLDGQSLVSIDNLNGAVSGDALCQMIERPLVQIRPLGVSKLVRIENKHTVFATGNNLNLVGDIVRRTVLCTLDTGLERPEMRPFKGDPVDTVRADRGKYIAAVLTIVLAYKEAGFPGKRRDLGSFEQWSEIVRSPLMWLGCADPVVTMENARAEDPVLSSLSAVMNAWRDSIGLDIPLSAGDLKASAQMSVHPDLHAALLSVAGDKSGIDAVRLGRWLSKYKGRIVGGLLFESQWGTNAKQNVWILKKSAGVAGVSGCVSSLRGKTVRLDDTNNTHTPDTFLEGSENTPANTRITRKDILSDPIGVFA